MKTVCVVSMGANEVKNYLGVFDDKQTAINYLVSNGCILEPAHTETINGKEYQMKELVKLTEEFCTNTNISFYSVGGDPVREHWSFYFDTIETNKFVRSYDDD